MSVFVVNRLTFSAFPDDLEREIADAFPPAFDALEGFRSFRFVRTGDLEAVVLIEWDGPEQARAGAARLGPTVFNDVVAPHLAEQDRRAGPVTVEHLAP